MFLFLCYILSRYNFQCFPPSPCFSPEKNLVPTGNCCTIKLKLFCVYRDTIMVGSWSRCESGSSLHNHWKGRSKCKLQCYMVLLSIHDKYIYQSPFSSASPLPIGNLGRFSKAAHIRKYGPWKKQSHHGHKAYNGLSALATHYLTLINSYYATSDIINVLQKSK